MAQRVQAMIQIEPARAQSRAALIADLVSLYKAQGGGWKDDDLTVSSKGDDALFEQ